MFKMGNLKAKDPLLTAAKVILILLTGLVIFVMVMLGIGIGAVLTVGKAELMAEIARIGAPDSAYWVVLAIMLAIIGLMWLGYRFFTRLWAVIQSVDEGDPFRASNAELLAEMGWISVGVQITLLIMAGPVAWLAGLSEKAGEPVNFELDLGLSSILLTLILFILARVFRHGAAMRDDLEGTV